MFIPVLWLQLVIVKMLNYKNKAKQNKDKPYLMLNYKNKPYLW